MSLPSQIIPASSAQYSVRRRWLGSGGYWLGQIAFWGLFAAFLLTNNLADTSRKETVAQVWETNLVAMVLGIVVSHLFRVGLIGLRARAKGWWMFLGGFVPLSLVTGAAANSILFTLGAIFEPDMMLEKGLPPTVTDYFAGAGFFSALLTVWAGFYLGYCYYRGYREGVMDRLRLQAEVKEAELRTLKAQVNPHFLFNSLNTLRSMIPTELDRPREAVTLLAELLRATLTLGDRTTVSIAEEVETVENYLALERLRFERRLRIRSQVDPTARLLPIPPLLLQTLVENAVKFGVGRHSEGGEVAYEVAVRDAALVLRVTNNGKLGLSGGRSTGVGLANARARLLNLFGPAATLALSQADADTVLAEVRIPVSAATPALSIE